MKKGLTLILLMGTIYSFAQQAVPATGGEATGSGGKSSYTVGQSAYTTKTDGSNTSVEGVQQTYTIVDESGINDNFISIEILTYPNPTTDKIQIQISDPNGKSLTYFLLDNQGKELINSLISTNITELDLNHYARGTYFLKIKDQKEELKTVKIIKN
ncbi:MAG: T9SS type A sorting domain-containing protein [Crocinitomicaceae bacterium]